MDELIKARNSIFVLMLNMKMLHWGTKGSHFYTLHNLFDDYDKAASSHLDELTEIIMMELDTPPKLSSLDSAIEYIENTDNIGCPIERTMGDMSTILDLLVSVSKLDICPIIKSKIEEIGFYYKKEMEYKLRRMVL